MSIAAELQTLYRLALAPVRGHSHAERLESFYQGQAEHYDAFRRKLLPGRDTLFAQVPMPEGGTWVDLGGGTGSSLEFVGDRARQLDRVYIVDLSPSLLRVAAERVARAGLTNVELIEADATTFQPPRPADLVTCSYSLTMIPDWFAAVDRARRMLAPGGTFAALDFYVSRKYSSAGSVRHGWWTRHFWPAWFSSDSVFLSPDHLPYLRSRFECVVLRESVTRVPYVPLVRVPYYLFIGRHPSGE